MRHPSVGRRAFRLAGIIVALGCGGAPPTAVHGAAMSGTVVVQ